MTAISNIEGLILLLLSFHGGGLDVKIL